MAPYLLYGSRSTKTKKKEEEEERRVAGPAQPSKRSSKMPTAPVPSASRTKPNQLKEESAKAARVGTTKAASKDVLASRPNPGKSQVASGSSGTLRDLNSGQGVRMETSSSRPPPTTLRPINPVRQNPSASDQHGIFVRSEGSDPRATNPRTGDVEAVSYRSEEVAPFPGSILGISVPLGGRPSPYVPNIVSTRTEFATSNSRIESYMSSQIPHRLSTVDLPPPTPSYTANDSSVSSRYSESPGPYSRISTPNTSLSSHSPALAHSSKFSPARPRLAAAPSQSYPPVVKRKIGGSTPVEETSTNRVLSVVRESSSSSSSTIKASEPANRTNPATRSRLDGQSQPTSSLRLPSKRLPKSQAATTPPEERIGRTLGDQPRYQPSSSAPSEQRQNSLLRTRLPALKTDRSRIPPPRPTRDGTPTLESFNQTVIQSNLSHLATTGHKRRDSVEKILMSSSSKTDRTRTAGLARSPSISSDASRKPAKLSLPARPSATSTHPFPSRDALSNRELPPLVTEVQTRRSKTEPSPTSVSPGKTANRFGLFSRRIKSPVDPVTRTVAEKPVKKGPAAGTGHEGYGRYARHGRSSSSSTVGSRGRSLSTDRSSFAVRPPSSRKSSFTSNEEPLDLDDFFKDRLEPVVIGGGGVIRGNRNSMASLYQSPSAQTSTASITSSIRTRFRPGTITDGSNSSLTSLPMPSRELLPPPSLVTPAVADPLKHQTLAHRRSHHRSLRMSGTAESARLPPPIDTRATTSSPAISSYDTNRSSVAPMDAASDLSDAYESRWLSKKKSQTTAKAPRRWNFFQRASRSPQRIPLDSDRGGSRLVPVAVSEVADARYVAHYAMLDGSESGGEQSLEDILRNLEDDLELRDEKGAFVDADAVDEAQERKHSILLPSPPKFPADFQASQQTQLPRVPLIQPRSTPLRTPEYNPSRLQQVGRIPRVVSRTSRLHRPAQQSFSRPFGPRSGLDFDSTPTPPAIELDLPLVQPSLRVQTDAILSTRWAEEAEKAFSAPAVPINEIYNLEGEPEFLAFSPRKGSDGSGSSSSGPSSFVAMAALAAKPSPSFTGDEVWNEYDELLDIVGSPFSLDSGESEKMLSKFPSLSKIGSYPQGSTKKGPAPLNSDRSSGSTAKASPSRPPLPVRPPELELPPQLHFDTQAQSPISLSDLYSTYNQSCFGRVHRQGSSSSTSGSCHSIHTAFSTGSRSSTSSSHIKRVTQAMAVKTNSARDSLRFSALMTSRWLSFDRVLFSPIAEEILSSNLQARVLVLDGITNDDWSSYCALTYPTATVYNLSTALKESTLAKDWIPPTNHRFLHQPSLEHPFPFPKGFFAAVILRFPPLLPSSHLANAVAECKRVLRPGGYLELTLLDIDLVNMGDRARRAVRNVKLAAQEQMPEANLAPVSDAVMKQLGRRGFENLNRCVVSVPVAGSVLDGAAVPSDDARTANAPSTPRGLVELLREASDGVKGLQSQYPISEMVCRVGRWWWSRCYETAIDAPTIWADQELLRECEERETGLRLLVAYAQKPVVKKRRTVSV